MVKALAFVACLALAGCAELAAAARDVPDGADPATPETWRLERIVSRTWLIDDLGAPVPGPRERIALAEPFAIAARDLDLYVADRGLGATFRYDFGLEVLEPVIAGADCARAAGCTIAAGGNRVSYYARAAGSPIVGADWRGEPLRFAPAGAAARIAALGVDRRGDVNAIDPVAARTFRYSRDGALLEERVLSPAPPLRTIAAWTGDGWWIVDAAAGTARLHAIDGVARTEPRTLGIADVVAAAADERGTLYVASGAARAVYALTPTGTKPLADADGAPHRFGPIAALAAAAGRVYVACGTPGRIEIWRADGGR